MTNKEAIDWLVSIRESIHGGDEEFDNRRKEALNKAIESMSIHQKDWQRVKDLQRKVEEGGYERKALMDCLNDAHVMLCRTKDLISDYEHLLITRKGFDEAMIDFQSSCDSYDRFLKDKEKGNLLTSVDSEEGE